jgi:hypothetical protein
VRRLGVPELAEISSNRCTGAPFLEFAHSSAVRFAQAAQSHWGLYSPPASHGLRLSELRWRWCRGERSCITLHSCSTVANATLALARAQHDSTVIRLLSPPLRKSVRPHLPTRCCATRNTAAWLARLNMRLGSTSMLTNVPPSSSPRLVRPQLARHLVRTNVPTPRPQP